MIDLDHLRPIERRVGRLTADGVAPGEIARRFRRSRDHIERVLELSALPGRRGSEQTPGLRPLERRLLTWRSRGATSAEMAARFRRGPAHIERVLALADDKLQRSETSS